MTQGTDKYPDYFYVNVPENKPFEEFDTSERRAYLLKKAIEKGTPRAINQTKMAKKFDKTQQQISQDINGALVKSINQHLEDSEKLKAEITSIYDHIKEEAREKQDLNLLRLTLKDWKDWLGDIGSIEEEPQKVEMTHDVDDSVEQLISFHKDDRGQDE